MTAITKSHWVELVIRSIIFLLALVSYIVCKVTEGELFKYIVNGIILVFFTYKMIARLIPNIKESMGNQKIFKKNYTPIENLKKGIIGYNKKEGNRLALIVGIVWVLLNCICFVLYFCGVIDRDLMMVIAMFFSVCDLICVLVICPFQKIFMRNKCCNTCRIYNWDFPMMFTPLWVVPSVLNYILVVQSFIVLGHWEWHHRKYPERFYEETNSCLSCKSCKELMCKNRLRKVVDIK